MAKLTDTIIEAAIAGFEAQKKELDAQIAQLRGMMNGTLQASGEPAPARPASKLKGRRLSAATLEKMRAAQQARWAKVRGESAPAKTAIPTKPKRTMSAAARKAIGAAMKKRWAAKKAN